MRGGDSPPGESSLQSSVGIAHPLPLIGGKVGVLPLRPFGNENLAGGSRPQLEECLSIVVVVVVVVVVDIVVVKNHTNNIIYHPVFPMYRHQ